MNELYYYDWIISLYYTYYDKLAIAVLHAD
jgi:hypothetical protein